MNDTGNVVVHVAVVTFRFNIRNSLLFNSLDFTGSGICLDGKTNVVWQSQGNLDQKEVKLPR